MYRLVTINFNYHLWNNLNKIMYIIEIKKIKKIKKSSEEDIL